MNRQQTIEHDVEISGRGLFTGVPVNLRFRPAAVGSGVTFVRSDQPTPIRIPATVDNLTKRARRSSLRNGAVAIETVEHCLAAIRGLLIDNIDIELDADELPAVDGSCLPFMERLQEAGIVKQDGERRIINVPSPVRVCDGEAELVAWPGRKDQLEVIYELDYGPDSPIGRQVHTYVFDTKTFVDEIAPARTFVTDREAEALRAAGLGTHLKYEDILVIGAEGPIDNAFRFPNECVRHKILDLVGDLMLGGAFICGTIYARKSGHSLNHELVRRLLEIRARERLESELQAPARFDVRAVQRILPHRFPMLMIDRVVEIEQDRRAVGIKNVTINEPFFQGHYPQHPIMPGVLIIEAMAQLGGLLLSQKLEHTGKVAVLLSLDNVKFRRPVVPGDQLVIEAIAKRVKARTGEVACTARTDNETCAEAVIRFMLVDSDTN